MHSYIRVLSTSYFWRVLKSILHILQQNLPLRLIRENHTVSSTSSEKQSLSSFYLFVSWISVKVEQTNYYVCIASSPRVYGAQFSADLVIRDP